MVSKQNSNNGTGDWPGEWRSSKGVVVKIRPVQPLLISKVVASVKIPQTPVYEVRTLGGAIERHPYDADVAAETPGGLTLWNDYLTRRRQAESEQNEKVANALFVFGTHVDDLPTGWEDMHIAAGIDVPTEANAKRAYWLATELSAYEVTALIKAIMKLSGVTEEEIGEAGDSFRS